MIDRCPFFDFLALFSGFGEVLASPAPVFNRAQDAVVVSAIPWYGSKKWSLSAVRLPFTEIYEDLQAFDGFVFKWFGRLLLEGRVDLHPAVSQLLQASHEDLWRDPPSMLTSSKYHNKTALHNYYHVLSTHSIINRSRLLQIVRSQPSFLLSELLALMRLSYHAKFRVAWTHFSQSLTDSI